MPHKCILKKRAYQKKYRTRKMLDPAWKKKQYYATKLSTFKRQEREKCLRKDTNVRQQDTNVILPQPRDGSKRTGKILLIGL